VSEDLEIKRSLWQRVAALRAAGSIVSTNTSGIPLARISEGFPADFRQHFLGTHFFNPPRYLHLAEVIPGADTKPEVLDWVSTFCELHLGKGVVRCKDTPNFIANCIGASSAPRFYHLTEEAAIRWRKWTLTGLDRAAEERELPAGGYHRPGCLGACAANLYAAAPDDPARELHTLAPWR
jgi:3-hydroxyacyl-CoA dehydrogenase